MKIYQKSSISIISYYQNIYSIVEPKQVFWNLIPWITRPHPVNRCLIELTLSIVSIHVLTKPNSESKGREEYYENVIVPSRVVSTSRGQTEVKHIRSGQSCSNQISRHPATKKTRAKLALPSSGHQDVATPASRYTCKQFLNNFETILLLHL